MSFSFTNIFEYTLGHFMNPWVERISIGKEGVWNNLMCEYIFKLSNKYNLILQWFSKSKKDISSKEDKAHKHKKHKYK